ncbi:MAG: TetR/AcrR family transcriptional regulator [Candidatus Solibacter sp.]|nr:TetR/AcrR family transcriptional regulator [Candidatus Solibacter sp.]
MHDSRTPTLRLPASDRRLQLIETALDCFSRRGFGGTTTKEIAAAAGVTEAIIFRHFPTKHDLYNAVIDHHHTAGNITECMAQCKCCMDCNDDEGLVRTIVEKILESHRRDQRGHRVLLFAALEGHETGLAHARQLSVPIFEMLCQYLTRRQKEGALREGNPGAIVAAVAGMTTHYANMTQMFGFPTTVSDRQIADSFVAIVMHGIQENPQTQRAQ